MGRRAPLSHGPNPFTARERQVLDAMADGLSCRDIGQALGISPATVRKHRNNMLAKVQAHNAAGLVAIARRKGWLKPAHAPPARHAHAA